jgi:integrase
MPSYKDKKSGRWRYRFAYDGQRFSGSAPKAANTMKVADQLERKHLEKLMSNQYTGVMPTVAAFVDRFLEYQKARVKPLTYELNENQLKLHVVPLIGKLKLDSVGSLELDGLVTTWQKSSAPRTINSRLGTVLRMFAVAVEWKILRSGPQVEALKVPKDAPRFLSETEAQELIYAAKFSRNDANDWHSMIVVGLRTGLRIGELRGLQWADIDFKGSAVHVQRTEPGRAGMTAGSTKGGRGRVVPLTGDARECLQAKLVEAKRKLGPQWHPAGWIWPMRGNADRAVSTSSCSGAMLRLAEKAKLTDVGWHTLRHTFGSWLVMRGVPIRAVQELLGHADMKQTQRYAHLSPGFAHHAAVASLDLALVKAPTILLPSGDDD